MIVKQIKALVEVNDVALKEYKDPDDQSEGDKEAVRYIEVPPLAEFKIRVKFPKLFKPPCDHLSVDIIIDGVHCISKVVQKKKYGKYLGVRETVIAGTIREIPNGGNWWFSPFRFEELESVGPINHNLTAEKVEKFGKLEVKVQKYTVTSRESRRPSNVKKVVQEKIPKAILINTTLTHSIGSGPGYLVNREERSSRLCGGTEGTPLASFTFKYRSRRALQRLKIIRESPEPAEKTVTKFTRAQLLERIKALEAANNDKIKLEDAEKVKRERDEEVDELLDGASGKRIKTTTKYRTRKVELVDLEAEEDVDVQNLDNYVQAPIVLG